LLSGHADKLTDDGRARLVRHGHLPEREIMTGIGPVAVRCPRVRDRVGEGSERIRFSAAILLAKAHQSKSFEVLIPILYLKGVSTGDFAEALVALLGNDAGGLYASTIARLKKSASDEHRSNTTLWTGRSAALVQRPFHLRWFASGTRCRNR
jgi:putative transposase